MELNTLSKSEIVRSYLNSTPDPKIGGFREYCKKYNVDHSKITNSLFYLVKNKMKNKNPAKEEVKSYIKSNPSASLDDFEKYILLNEKDLLEAENLQKSSKLTKKNSSSKRARYSGHSSNDGVETLEDLYENIETNVSNMLNSLNNHGDSNKDLINSLIRVRRIVGSFLVD